MFSLITVCLAPLFISVCNGEVVWALNCGGPSHVDVNGITYMADQSSIGIASDYGRSFSINRVAMEDQIVYQTERYNTDDFSYDIPYPEPGDYVITLKFSEVWFTEPRQKVFHVQLNHEVFIIESLDIFGEVGFATALDHHIPIHILDDSLIVQDQIVPLSDGSFSLNFIKTEFDNPKINAIVLTKGSLNDVPQLPPLEETEPTSPRTPEHTDDDSPEDIPTRRPAGVTRAPDPYESTESTTWLLPLIGTLAALIPVIFCLCKI